MDADQQKRSFILQSTISVKSSATVHKVLREGEWVTLKIIRISKQQLDRLLQQINYRSHNHLGKAKLKTLSINSEYSIKQQGSNVQVYIYLPFIPHINWNTIIRSRQKSQNEQESEEWVLYKKYEYIDRILRSIICRILISPRKIIYSLQNVFYDESREVVEFNLASFAGIKLIKYEEKIEKNQLLEIIDNIDSKIFERQKDQRISIQLKFRSIGLIILSLIFKNKILFFDEAQLPQYLELIDVKQILKESKLRFRKLLQAKKVREIISEAQRFNHAHYYYFLTQIFVEQKQKQWKEVIRLLFPKWTKEKHRPLIENQLVTKIALRAWNCQSQNQKQYYEQMKLTNIFIYFLVKLQIDISPFLGCDSLEEILDEKLHLNKFGVQTRKSIINICVWILNQQKQLSLKQAEQSIRNQSSSFMKIGALTNYNFNSQTILAFIYILNNNAKQNIGVSTKRVVLMDQEGLAINRYRKL